ncbi:MAG TPA: 50S ribosomal protein L25 [Clostridiales bacterium]|jgi:large subunit ribosomal protein L25|nr:50S ribosomal protein L25 [Clostridiales bacterium]
MKLKSTFRGDTGTSRSRKIRQEGSIPAVLYGKDIDVKTITVDTKDFKEILKSEGRNAIVDIELDGESYFAMLKDVQTHPITNDILHLEFYNIDRSQKVEVTIPIRLVGKEISKIEGAVVHQLDEVEIRCPSTKIPRQIELDITELTLGHSLHVSDLEKIEDIEILNDPEEMIVSVTTIDEEPEDELEEELTGEEPVLIGSEDDEEAEEPEEDEE